MSRHRSPSGRRAYRRPPLPAPVPAAGFAGAHRTTPTPFVVPAAATRLAVAVAVGGALTVSGSFALAGTLPAAASGDNPLRLSFDELAGAGPVEDVVTVAGASVGPVAPEVPGAVLGAPIPELAEVVKGADLAVAAAAQAAALAEQARAAEAARVADATREQAAGSSTSGGVQMLTGRVTSGFGARWGTQHRGLDIAAPIGTPIRVPLAGVVVDAGPASGFGLWVRVRHGDGTMTVYGHINRSLVSVGQSVAAGEVIAEVGNRGQSTGPHLHFEVSTPGGTTINPRPWLDERGIGYT